MSAPKDENKNSSDVNKFKLLSENVDDLSWLPRKVPYTMINPCTQPFDEIEKVMIDLHDGGKIKKVIIEHGRGGVIPWNAAVYLHYSCYVEEDKMAYDCSAARSLTPKHYQLGGGFLFRGFEICLSSMRENETAQFLIHPDYAYGKAGCPPRIPGNTRIMVVVTVTDFIDCGFVTLSKRGVDVEFYPYEEKLKIAKSHSALAMDYYKRERMKMAFHHFREAQYIIDDTADSEDKELKRRNFLEKTFVNEMMCLSNPKYLRPKQLIDVATSAEKVLPELAQKSAKYHYCLGVAYTYLHQHTEATDSFKKAQILSPFLPRLGKAVKFLHEEIARSLKQEKVIWQGAFNKLGYYPVPDIVQTEPEDIITARRQTNEMITRCLTNQHFSCINLGSGFTKSERRILAVEAEKAGLVYEQYTQGSQIIVEIKKKK